MTTPDTGIAAEFMGVAAPIDGIAAPAKRLASSANSSAASANWFLTFTKSVTAFCDRDNILNLNRNTRIII